MGAFGPLGACWPSRGSPWGGWLEISVRALPLSWAPLLLGLSWGPIGHLLDRPEALLIRLGTLLGGSWTVLDAVKAPKANMLKTHVFRKDWDDFCNLGLVCGAVEALLRRLGRLLCRLGQVVAVLGVSWRGVEPAYGHFHRAPHPRGQIRLRGEGGVWKKGATPGPGAPTAADII